MNNFTLRFMHGLKRSAVAVAAVTVYRLYDLLCICLEGHKIYPGVLNGFLTSWRTAKANGKLENAVP